MFILFPTTKILIRNLMLLPLSIASTEFLFYFLIYDTFLWHLASSDFYHCFSEIGIQTLINGIMKSIQWKITVEKKCDRNIDVQSHKKTANKFFAIRQDTFRHAKTNVNES